jgi:tetratricopeptide (TPR) repeat protein
VILLPTLFPCPLGYTAPRGFSYNNLGQYERAIQDYDDTFRLDPQYAQAYYARGYAYQGLGKSTEAERDIAKAKELGYNP